MRDQGRALTVEELHWLFCSLIDVADELVGAAAATGYGINSKPLMKILKAAAQYMNETRDLQFEVSRVLARKERPSFEDVLSRLTQIAEQPGSAIVASLSGALDHWTVIRNIGLTTVQLFDSSQLARIKIANCRMSYDAPLQRGREHILHPRSLFQLTCELPGTYIPS